MASRAIVQMLLLLTILRLVTAEPGVSHLDTVLVNREQLSVSGLSSGGFFAVQFHVAFSESIMGAGIIAAGPYLCARGNLTVALTVCLNRPELISVPELVNSTNSLGQNTTKIDNPSHLHQDKVYVFSGKKDTNVVPGVTAKLVEFYSSFTARDNIAYEMNISAQHAIVWGETCTLILNVTDRYGNPCSVLQPPFINNCNYSTAFHLLQHIYGDIRPAEESSARQENLMEMDQSQFFDQPAAISMDNVSYIYVPSNCQRKQKICRLHIAFHGCLQGRAFIQDTYALHAGYNGVAEVNDIIILYPQVINTTSNSLGCWDWVGSTSPDYATKLGPQMAGVKRMLDRAVSAATHPAYQIYLLLLLCIVSFHLM